MGVFDIAASIVVAVHHVVNSHEGESETTPQASMALTVQNVDPTTVNRVTIYVSDHSDAGFFQRISFFKDAANESDFSKWLSKLATNPAEKFLFSIDALESGRQYVLRTVLNGIDDTTLTHAFDNLVPFSAPEEFTFSVNSLSNSLQISNASLSLNGFANPMVELVWQQDGKSIQVQTLTWVEFGSYVMSGLENDKKVDVRAFAKNAFGIAQSPLYDATPTSRPVAVSLLSVVPSDSQLVASWVDSNNAALSSPVSKYTVKLSSVGKTDVLKEVMVGSPLNCTFDGLENGTGYSIIVAAVNIYGSGVPSTITRTPFKAPSFLTLDVTDGDAVTALKVKVSAPLTSNGSVITSIKLYIVDPSNPSLISQPKTVSLDAPFSEQDFVFSNLSQFTKYNVFTRVFFDGANGEQSTSADSGKQSRFTLGTVDPLTSASVEQADIDASTVAKVIVGGLTSGNSVIVMSGNHNISKSTLSGFDMIVNHSSANQQFDFYHCKSDPNDSTKDILSTKISQVFTPKRRITAPTLLAATLKKADNTAKITFAFDKPTQFSALNHSGPVSFQIAYGAAGVFSTINAAETDGSFSANLDMSNLTTGSNSIRVRAQSQAPSYGSEASTTLVYSVLPSGDLALKAFPGNGTCALSWTKLLYSGYYIRFKKITAISYDPKDFFKIEDPLITDYILSNLDNWVEYEADICAYNALDEKSQSSAKNFVCATAAGPVTDLVIEYLSTGTGAKLTFAPPAGNPNIRILKYVLLNSNEVQLAASSSAGGLENAPAEISVTGLASGVTNALKIHAVTALATSSLVYSPPLAFDLIPRKAPSDISLELNKDYGSANDDLSLNINVDYKLNNIELDVVELYFKGQLNGDPDVLAGKSINKKFIIDKDRLGNALAPNSLYTLIAKVINKLGQSTSSSYFTFKLVSAVANLGVIVTPGDKKCTVALTGLDANSPWELDSLKIAYRLASAANNNDASSSTVSKDVSSLVNGSPYEFSVVTILKLKNNSEFTYTTNAKVFSNVVPFTGLSLSALSLVEGNKKCSLQYSNGGLSVQSCLFLVAFDNNEGLVHKLSPEELIAVFGTEEKKDGLQTVVIDVLSYTTIVSKIKHITLILSTSAGLEFKSVSDAAAA